MAFQIITNQSGLTDLYKVTNGVDDVVDNDHNTVVDGSISLALRMAINYGGGEDGQGVLGSLTNPSTGSGAYLIASNNGSGRLTGSFRYRATFFNLSGETTATGDSGTDIVASSNKITVSNLPISTQTAVIQGRRIYRSADAGSTWKLIAQINDNTTTSFSDNNDLTSGASIPSSNTTGVTGTISGGTYHFTNFKILSGQTLTLANSTLNDGILIAKCLGTVLIQGTINGKGKNSYGNTSTPTRNQPGDSTYYNPGTTFGISPSAGTTITSNKQIYGYGTDYFDSYFQQGDGYGGGSGAGGTIIVQSKGDLTVSGTIDCDGISLTSATASGSAGGRVELISSGYLNTTGATLKANGGSGANGNGSVYAGGGGGGGFIILVGQIVNNGSTNTVNGGAAGTQSTGTGASGGGGAYSGNGGTGSATAAAGSAGQIITTGIDTFWRMIRPIF